MKQEKMLIAVTWYGQEFENSGNASLFIEQDDLSSNATSIGIHSISELIRSAMEDAEKKREKNDEETDQG